MYLFDLHQCTLPENAICIFMSIFKVFKDMIIGVHQRPGDLPVNVCKTKALTNMRAAGSDENVKLVPPLELNLDIAVEYIQEDELVEVTPTKVRMMKHPNHKEWAKKRKNL
jgi:GTP-binding protein